MATYLAIFMIRYSPHLQELKVEHRALGHILVILEGYDLIVTCKAKSSVVEHEDEDRFALLQCVHSNLMMHHQCVQSLFVINHLD